MKKFWKNRHGAVTVMVTLLLIPAILVTGTGVDIARIYTAYSLMHDANQLAANSALAEYNALLQDLYGLYAISQTNDELNALINNYVKVALSNGDGEGLDDQTQEFALFGGGTPTATLTAASGQNLATPAVLRRQIEEYSLLRGPVIIAQELLERLDEFKKVKADAAVIDKKTEVEDRIEKIDSLYRQIYASIQELDGGNNAEQAAVNAVNNRLQDIYNQFRDMKAVRDLYTPVVDDGNADNDYLMEQYEDHYGDIAGNIRILVAGGYVGTNWKVDEEDNTKGEFTDDERVEYGLDTLYTRGSNVAVLYKEELENLATLCQKADAAKNELKQAIDDLEKELDERKCSKELDTGLRETKQENGKTMIENYRQMVQYDLGSLARTVKTHNGEQLDNYAEMFQNFKDRTAYVSGNAAVEISSSRLRNFSAGDFDIQVDYRNQHKINTEQEPDDLKTVVNNPPKTHQLPVVNGYGYTKFRDFGGDHQKFYDMLEAYYGNDGQGSAKDKDNAEKEQKGKITAIFKAIKDLFQNAFDPQPEGAWKYTGGTDDSGKTTGSDFGTGDWGDNDAIKSDLKSSLNSDIISSLGDLAGNIGDKLLLLAYASEMFSCYTSGRGDDKDPKTMAGIPLSIDVNYYYQSELEYIYNGNLKDALANVNSLGSMLLLVRFVFDYVVSFSVESVNTTVNAIKSALSFLGPIAIGIGELARLGLALGEALTDLSLLRSGYRVALIKNGQDYTPGGKGDWYFSIVGMTSVTADLVKDKLNNAESTAKNEAEKTTSSSLDKKTGLYYFDYVRIFLLFVDGDDMASRISNLIGLNMTNKINKIGDKKTREERETAMTNATRFDMEKAITGFSITTTAEFGMMFLSMPLAQNQFEGIVPPKTITISATDYRGY